MKKFTLLFLPSFIASVNLSMGQTMDLPQKHRLGGGAIFGYDHKLEGIAYGAELMYEYKPFKRFGFIAGLSYQQTRKNLSSVDFSTTGTGVLIHNQYAVALGTRYYLNSFYLGGALGLAYEYGKTKMDDGTTFKGGDIYSLYKAVGMGYQLPLRNGDLMEFELGTFGTNKAMKLGGTVRYKFLR